MRLERKQQKLATLPEFFIRLARYMIFALILVVCSVGIGVWGYYHFAGLSLIDSFHMSCLILAGMGPSAEMKTDAAKIFSSFYALYSGLAFISITAVFFTPIIHRVFHILHLEDN